MDKENTYLFELSWEVCNKVGGIHTVIASKIFEAQNHFSNYFCMGPYKSQGSDVFDSQDPPEWMRKGIEELKNRGIDVYYGVWNVDGFPEVLLIDFMGYSCNVNECKGELWNLWGVDSLGSQWYDFDEGFIWSWTCGIVIEVLMKYSEENTNTIVHAHEWMSGGAIAYLSTLENSEDFSTVFTTHATMLGRTMFSKGYFLDELDKQSPEELAVELGVKTKFQFEKALAHNSNCFTTVSTITAKEAEKILDKSPDVLTYNGFDSRIDDLYALEKQYIHSRNQIDNFLMKYFYDFFNYNYKDSVLLYLSGRYELKNKGVDVVVEALSELNEVLKQNESHKEVVFWFMLMFGEYELDEKVKESLNHCSEGKPPLHLGYAPLSPYKLPLDNELVKLLVEKNLVNKESDPVKIIITPTTFNGDDGLINMDYYKLISGFDLGVFPSLYEPWGYTPAESLSYGVPAISSDLTGIGKKACKFNCDESFMILNREDASDQEAINQLVEMMCSMVNLSSKNQMKRKIQAKLCSQKFSWKVFYKYYLEAYQQVVSK